MVAKSRTELLPSSEIVGRASENYLRNLNLPANSNVLIVRDKFQTNTIGELIDQETANKINRREMTDNLLGLIQKKGLKVTTVEFDENSTEKEINGDTQRALEELGKSNQTTIIYMGDDWSNRSSMYDAANKFGELQKVKMALSLGFSTGDCRVMSELDAKKMEELRKAEKYYDQFFIEHKKGTFDITTRNEKRSENDPLEYHLSLDYDTTKAKFTSELGEFDGVHEPILSEKHPFVNVVNIPGGEKFGAAFPFKNVNGQFSAEGIVFTIEKGFIKSYEMKTDRPRESYTQSQRDLLDLLDSGKKDMPVAELGLGFYSMIGQKTYPDCSTLSSEKTGPHIGFGHTDETSEAEEINEHAGKFWHTDFVLDNANMIWYIDHDQMTELKVRLDEM